MWHRFFCSASCQCRVVFISTGAAGFDEPEFNLSGREETDGATILCVNTASSEEELQRMGYFPGGGVGGMP
jgi:hypothetical protein